MSGFHTATICADCEPPVVAISTGNGSRCPQCGHVETWRSTTPPIVERPDGALARQVIRDAALRSDGDARILVELAQRLRVRLGDSLRVRALEEELVELRDLADVVSDADITALPPELIAVRQRWLAEAHAKDLKAVENAPSCPHCAAGEPSVWDDVLFHYAHPDGSNVGKLKMCHAPWRERCRHCSADVGTSPCACSSGSSAGLSSSQESP